MSEPARAVLLLWPLRAAAYYMQHKENRETGASSFLSGLPPADYLHLGLSFISAYNPILRPPMCALPAQSSGITIDSDRLNRELETLASFSDAQSPSVTRIVFSESDRRAREYVKGLCGEAGLAIREDAVGNTFARWNGERPEEAAIGTG